MSKAKKIGGVVAKKVTATFVNPYRVGGGYHASVAALMSLGMNKMHSFDAIVPAVKKAMGSEYKDFAAWESGKETAYDATKRILTNVMVTSRKDYGLPLRELGYEVRYDGREKTAGLFKLAPAAKKGAKKAK